jgi:hypothetical protein
VKRIHVKQKIEGTAMSANKSNDHSFLALIAGKLQGAFPLALLLLVFLSGCKAPDPKPFQDYAAAVHGAGDNMELALSRDTDWSREKYISSVLNGSVKLRDIALFDKKGPFNVVFPGANGLANQPTFYRLQSARLTLVAMNEATKKYVDLLATLASSDLISPDSFESMAGDVNHSFDSIATTLKAQLPGEALPVLSLATSEVMRAIAENHRHKALEEILEKSQKPMEQYSSLCLKLLRIMDQSLTTDYDAQATRIEDEFSQIAPGKRASDPDARKLVEQLLQLNTDYLALMNSLIAAKNIYETLPQGHSDLLKSLQNKPTNLAAIKELFSEAQRLKRIYNELKQ